MPQTRGDRGKIITMLVLLLVIAAYLTGCLSPQTASITPTPTKTPRPIATDTVPPPTVTHTPQPPTATFTLTPSATPSPSPEPTQILTPTITAWPTLEANRCPLTGQIVDDPELLDRRPLAAKVQNAPVSRPQYGLTSADIVYEHLSEAGITRFTAIYLCQDITKIGSVRSARFIDLEIPAMYKSLLAFSGTSAGLYPKYLNADFYDRQFCYGWGLHPEGFYRDTDLRKEGIPIEHTLFADPNKIWMIADQLEINEPQDLQGLYFSELAPEGGQPATHVQVPYPHQDMIVDYRYDSDSGKYLRWDGGEPHIDALIDEQISVTNVVVLYAHHVDTDIYEDEPRRNHPSVQIQLWGNGKAVLFRDGLAYEGLWARPQRDDMVLLRDASGQVPIPLKPGSTWMQLVPQEGHHWAFEATWDSEE